MIKSGWQKSATVWIFAKNPPLAVENLIKIHHKLRHKITSSQTWPSVVQCEDLSDANNLFAMTTHGNNVDCMTQLGFLDLGACSWSRKEELITS